MDRCSTWVHSGGAPPITLMVLQEIIGLPMILVEAIGLPMILVEAIGLPMILAEAIGLPMILVEAIGLTKRRMLLIHMETFLFDLENIKDALV